MSDEKTEYSEDIKRMTRQMARSACRLEKLCELGAPAYIVELERRLLVKRMAAFPAATGEVAAQADSMEVKQGTER